ncbi:MAG: hypothetical protein KA170_09075 [Candidatus Promineofilum sp.]|nr:hypothetical protein [Promineifilum sp.]
MNYGDTLKRGWQLAWNNKWLWLLGFLAALGGGSGAASNSNYQMDPSTTPGTISPELAAGLTGVALLLCCVGIIVGILLWLVSLASKGGLITGVAELDRGQPSSFGRAFRQGWKKLLPLVGMTLLVFAVVIVLGIILAIGFAGTLAAALGAGASMDSNALAGLLGTAGFVFLCLLCLLIPLTLVLNLIYAFAYRGIMLRDMPVMDSIRHGWRVVREHVGEILLLGLIFFVVNLIIGVVATGIIGLLGISSGLFGLMMSGGEPTTTQIVAGIVGVLATFIIFAIISAIFTTWRSATFTLAYQQWTGKEALKDSAAPLPPAPMVS